MSLNKLSADSKHNLKCHENYVSTYTSDTHIARYKKKLKQTASSCESNPKRQRRSNTSEFSWKHKCLFCGESCSLEKDPKHPDRWREAYLCRTSERGTNSIYKDKLLKICNERNDNWAEEVRTRLSDIRASHDLHAADARYHNDCRKRFTGTKNIVIAKTLQQQDEDHAYPKISKLFRADPYRMWSSVNLEEGYQNEGGTSLSREELVHKIVNEYKNEVILLSSPGIANIVVFKRHASSVLRIHEVKTDNDDAIRVVANAIVSDIKNIPKDKEVYNSRIDVNSAKSEISPTLSKLLSMISPKELSKDLLTAILIGNMITSRVSKQYTDLLVSLAVMVRKKQSLQHLHNYGVLCSY